MGYLVFIEKLTPIFEFHKLAKKYETMMTDTGKSPYSNYNWIIGDQKMQIHIEE
jgi:hypothetical protein